MIEHGSLDRYVTVQQLTDSVGSSGFPVESWATLAMVWMGKEQSQIRTAQGEHFTAAQLSEQITTRWWLHYRADMDPELVDVTKQRRLSYKGRFYDIASADVMGLREGIELTTLAAGKVGV